MTFREVIQSNLGFALQTQEYEQAGVEIIENTPEEIRDVAVEMDERIKGTWETCEEDDVLQGRFWSLYKVKDLNVGFRSRLGREFLRQNRELLE